MFLYLTTNGTILKKDGGRFVVVHPQGDSDKNEGQIPIFLVEGIIIFGRIQITTDVINACLKGKIPVFFVSGKGNYFGKLDSLEYKNVEFLYNHIKASLDKEISLKYAKVFIKSKIKNSRTMLMKWSRYYKIEIPLELLNNLQFYLTQIDKIDNKQSLLGIEGTCAKIYFDAFKYFIKKPFEFNGRNRRPPKDPINSLLSLGYTLLAQTITMILDIYGFNTQIGFLHTPKDLKSLLVLDVMEMFRAWIIDDLVIRITQTEKMNLDDFYIDDENIQKPVLLSDDGLKKFIKLYYNTIFKQKSSEINGKEFIKLKMIEKTMEKFKSSLVQKAYNYEGFTVK